MIRIFRHIFTEHDNVSLAIKGAKRLRQELKTQIVLLFRLSDFSTYLENNFKIFIDILKVHFISFPQMYAIYMTKCGSKRIFTFKKHAQKPFQLSLTLFKPFTACVADQLIKYLLEISVFTIGCSPYNVIPRPFLRGERHENEVVLRTNSAQA